MVFLENANYNWLDLLEFQEKPFRAKLIPSKVWRDLDRYKNDAKGLSNYFKKWKAVIEFRKPISKATLYKTYIAVGGEYDPETRRTYIHIYNNDFNNFEWCEWTWVRFKYKVMQTLMHEMIHLSQYVRRGDKEFNLTLPYKKEGIVSKDGEKQYLSSNDEIQAYAHCAYMDLQRHRYNCRVKDYLNLSKKNPSQTLKYYYKTFNYDMDNNYAIPRLYKHILKWETKYKKIITRGN